MAIAGVSDWVHITEVGLYDFNHYRVPPLKRFDVVVFGISDGGDDIFEFSIGRLSDLRAYVEGGGGLVWTHDTLEAVRDLGLAAEEPAGVDFTPPWNQASPDGLDVRKLRNNPLFESPFDFRQYSSLTVGFTHSTGGKITTATPLLEFADHVSSRENFYLAVNCFGAGRVVVSEIGHSYFPEGQESNWECDELEARLLVNCLFWAAKVEPPSR